MPQGTKNMPPQKNLSRVPLVFLCHAEVNISKTICKTIYRPPPYGGWGGRYNKDGQKLFDKMCVWEKA